METMKFIADVQVKTKSFGKNTLFPEKFYRKFALPKTFSFEKFRIKAEFDRGFKELIVPEIPNLIRAFTGTLTKNLLAKSTTYDSILSVTSTFSIGEFLTIICTLLKKQKNGNKGALIVGDSNIVGDTNIFCVRLKSGYHVAVRISWFPKERIWYFSGLFLGSPTDLSHSWESDGCFFSKKTVPIRMILR